MKHPFLLNKTYHEWAEPTINLSELKKLGKFNDSDEFFLRVQGTDQQITDDNPVDLARNVIEQIYTVGGEKYQFIINGKLFISHEPTISEKEIRTVGRIPPDEILYFKVEGPDRVIKKGESINLKPFPIEEFYSTLPKLVQIKINNNPYEVKPGKFTVAEIKGIGGVSLAHDLDQLINGELVPLKDDGFVIIKGCEEFKSHPKDGSSS